jgi:hypothetical protein
MFKNKIQIARTLQAFAKIKQDIVQGAMANNANAKQVLQRAINQRARELGFKGTYW